MKEYAMGRVWEVGSDKDYDHWKEQKPLFDLIQTCGKLHNQALDLANEVANLEIQITKMIGGNNEV